MCSPTATSKAFLEERYSTERVRGNLYCQTAEHFLSTTVIPHDPAPRSCKETLLPTVQLLPSAAEPRREQIQPHKQGTPGRTKWMQSWDVISWSPLQNHRPVLGSKVENPSQDMSFFTVLCKARDWDVSNETKGRKASVTGTAYFHPYQGMSGHQVLAWYLGNTCSHSCPGRSPGNLPHHRCHKNLGHDKSKVSTKHWACNKSTAFVPSSSHPECSPSVTDQATLGKLTEKQSSLITASHRCKFWLWYCAKTNHRAHREH